MSRQRGAEAAWVLGAAVALVLVTVPFALTLELVEDRWSLRSGRRC